MVASLNEVSDFLRTQVEKQESCSCGMLALFSGHYDSIVFSK
jgi:hypothetical protein